MSLADAGPRAVAATEPLGPKLGAGGEFHIPSLDGIRAVSFMLVFLAHAGLGNVLPGGLGVTIFFFLSGYLITTLMRLERDRTGDNSLRDFYLRRVFRIFPPFYTVLFFALALRGFGWTPEPLQLGSVLSQFAHATNLWIVLHGTHGFPGGTVVYWSLAVEEHFYLVFPLLFIALQRWFPKQPTRQAAVLLSVCALVMAWRFVLVMVFDAEPNRTYMGSDTRLDSILFGCTLAVLGNPMLDPWRGTRALWCHVLLPAGFALLLFTIAYRAAWFRETLRYSLQGISLIPMFVVAIRYPEWGAMRALNVGWVRRLGLLSYSLYLCHQVVLAALEHELPGLGKLLYGVLAFAISYGLASAMLRFIERPAARARRAYVTTAWLKPVAAAPTPLVTASEPVRVPV